MISYHKLGDIKLKIYSNNKRKVVEEITEDKKQKENNTQKVPYYNFLLKDKIYTTQIQIIGSKKYCKISF